MSELNNIEISETKRKIIEASLMLFSRNGFNGTSIREIAKAVGIKGSSIYNHFENKDDILRKVFEYSKADHLHSTQIVDRYKQKDTNDPNAFISIILNDAEALYSNKAWNKVLKIIVMEMFQNESVHTLMTHDILTGARNELERLFNLLIEMDLIKNIDAKFYASELFSSILFTNIEFLLNEEFGIEYYLDLTRRRIEILWASITR